MAAWTGEFVPAHGSSDGRKPQGGHLGHIKPFIWLHIKKAGGTSMKAALGPAYVRMKAKREIPTSGPSDQKASTPYAPWPRDQWNDCLNNYRIPLGEYDSRRMLFARRFLYDEGEFAAAFKFAVTRNPYDRAVSCWHSCVHRLSLFSPRRLLARVSFESFLDLLPEAWETRKDRHLAMHTAPVWPDMTDENGALLLDRVVRLEAIDSDFARICEVLGLPPRSFPHLNRDRRSRAWRDAYSRRSRVLVERYYADDIENFHYEF
jgi:hypothetical protein